MGVTVSTSLARLRDNPVLQKFVGTSAIPETDEFWKDLLSFSYPQPRNPAEARLLEDTVLPLVEALVKHNPSTGNLRTLVNVFLDYSSSLRDESKCESNVLTWRVHNTLLILRITLKYMIQNLHEEEVIIQLDGSTTVPQITSLEKETTIDPGGQNGLDPIAALTQPVRTIDSMIQGQVVDGAGTSESDVLVLGEPTSSVNPAEIVAMETLLSRQLVEGVVSLLAEVPLLPFTYDIHLEAINVFLVLLSSQVFSDPAPAIILQHIVSVPSDLAGLLVHCLVQYVVSYPPLPPDHLRTHSTGFISSIASSLWSLVMPSSEGGGGGRPSPLRDQALLLLLVLTHQQTKGYNPFRNALYAFTDKHGGDKTTSSFSVNMERLYFALCQQLSNEQTSLFLYLVLQGNRNMASFVFSRSDIDLLVIPLLRQLHDCGSHSSHHIYMLLIIVLILSQDECFNKSVHEVNLSRVSWYTERAVGNISLGSLMVLVFVRTVQTNIAHIRDKYLHTNCLAALANMSAYFHSLHLDAAQKIVNLFKLLAKKHQKIQERLKDSTDQEVSPTPPQQYPDPATDKAIVEEVLLMVLEIINSTLTHSLHHNPHLVYSLLYQREIFEPFRTHPSFMDLIQNIETVVAFFSTRLEKSGPSPYSSTFVLETITQASKSWPRNRLREFPDLKFRYVEEDQPEEFFIPYVWTLVFKSSTLYWDSSRIQFSAGMQ